MEELINQYRSLSLAARGAILMVLGLLPGFYEYYDQGELVSQDLLTAQNDLSAKKDEFEAKRSKVNRLPEHEERLAFTQTQMDQAQKRLPNDFMIEDFLAKLATFAQENRALMTEFVPADKTVEVGSVYRYEELPIDVKFEGSYENIAMFLDEIAHLQTMVHIRDIKMSGTNQSAVAGEAEGDKAAQKVELVAKDIKVDKNSAAMRLRSSSMVNGSAKVVIFKSSNQLQAAPAPTELAPGAAPAEAAAAPTGNATEGAPFE